MGSFLYIRTFYPNRPWPGTHGPPSSLLRVAQRFERSENALDVVAGLSIIGLPPYHSVWCIFYVDNFLSEHGLLLNGEQLCRDGTHIHQRPTACWRIVACGMVQRNS